MIWKIVNEFIWLSGEMVIEYAGELIRSTLTDKRERYYDSKGIGCYMFKIDDNLVVDATMSGTAARFINHSCDVSWIMSKFLERIVQILKNLSLKTLLILNFNFLAKLLLESCWHSRSKAHHNLCPSTNRHWWRANVRLQVRHRGQQDSMWLRSETLQKIHELRVLEKLRVKFFGSS